MQVSSVFDVEDLAQFQVVRIMGVVAGAEGVQVVYNKTGESGQHVLRVEPFRFEDGGSC